MHVVSVRSDYASSPGRTAVVFCVFPPRPPLPHLGERGCKVREACRGWGLGGHVSGTRDKSTRHAPHHRWTGSFARASTSYSQCRAVSSTSTRLPSSTGRPTPLPIDSTCNCLYGQDVSPWGGAAVSGTKPPSRRYSTLVRHKKRNQIDQDAPRLSPRWAGEQAGGRAGVACGRITDDAQSLSRAPAKTHTPEHLPLLLHLHCPLALDLDPDPSR